MSDSSQDGVGHERCGPYCERRHAGLLGVVNAERKLQEGIIDGYARRVGELEAEVEALRKDNEQLLRAGRRAIEDNDDHPDGPFLSYEFWDLWGRRER